MAAVKNKNLARNIAMAVAVLLITGCAAAQETIPIEGQGRTEYAGLQDQAPGLISELPDSGAAEKVDPALKRTVKQAERISAEAYARQLGDKNISCSYRLGPSDVLSVTVYEDKELSVDALRITPQGTINLPLIGTLRVEEKTTSQVESMISRILVEKQYLVQPHVSIQIREYNSKEAIVLGAVARPGSYSLKKHETLLSLLSRAGGINEGAAGQNLLLIRDQKQAGRERTLAIQFNLESLLSADNTGINLDIRSGDTVYVPKAEKFFIIGQVKRPGGYQLASHTTVVEAISMAGGFTDIAAPNRVRISRIEANKKIVIQVDVNELTNGGRQDPSAVLQPNDLIMVPESYF